MLEFSDKQFEEIKTKGEVFYKNIGEIYCPYFQSKINFNAKGLEHLKFKKKNARRKFRNGLKQKIHRVGGSFVGTWLRFG